MGRADDGRPALLASADAARPERCKGCGQEARVGIIEIELPGGARVRVDAFVNEKSLRRVLQTLKDVA
jgi:hypothetical protein